MGGSPCRSSVEGLKRRAWTAEEDMILSQYIGIHGDSAWTNLPQKASLKRSGKSCRLRWLNYLRPDIDHGSISQDEEELIIRMHRLLGNRWSLIAGRLPGRTDNKIKKHWNTYVSKKLQMKESQRNTQILERKSTFPSPVQNHMFKPRPVKITTSARLSEIVRPNGCNGYGSNHCSDEASFELCNVKEIANSSKSAWCDLLLENSIIDNDSITGNDSELVAVAMADVNLVGTEVANSTCSMSYLADQQSPHSEYLAAPLAQSSMFLNELSSLS